MLCTQEYRFKCCNTFYWWRPTDMIRQQLVVMFAARINKIQIEIKPASTDIIFKYVETTRLTLCVWNINKAEPTELK